MKTEIFSNINAFWAREDKSVNGVSPEFAELHPDYAKQNETNKGCWNCYDCSGCSGCSDCYRCSGCYDCYRCSGCYDCSRCYRCYRCYDCSGCYDCYRCYRCSGKNGEYENVMQIPKIENIHQKVFEAVSAEGALDMGSWHACETTHCRAGWVVHLAGEEGKALESQTSTPFAAMMIYKASSDIRVSPTRFYETNTVAMNDIKRCAELESAK